ncbi:MAG: tryptophan--tRNA ligase [Alphaproteobacteria bacterium]|nr:MAG: tryptophan--tRNA ligase [Alphaproteobacteria bacterium]
MSKPVCFSGVQPSGNPTLGNYIGAFRPFTAYQNSHNAYFCVVDHHAITVRQDPKELRENSFAIAAWYIASGLNPAHCTLFIQSHVSAHAELGWILNTYTQMGELERMTQYKDKSARYKDNVNAGLFGYPVLMAADILLYNTQEVPVGDDQIQHIELCRDIATRFNGLHPNTFVMPKGVTPVAGARVKDLQDPTKKMSKSLPGAGCLLLADSPSEAAKKIKRAVTDTENHIAYNHAKQPGVSNLIDILGACTGRTPQQVVKEFEGQQYGALKGAVAEAVAFTLEPLQAEYNRLMADKAELESILRQGAEKANEVASATLKRVKTAVGYATF